MLEHFEKYGTYLWDKKILFCVFLAQSTWEPPPHWEKLVHQHSLQNKKYLFLTWKIPFDLKKMEKN